MEMEEIADGFFDEYLNLGSCGKQSGSNSIPPTPGGGSPQIEPNYGSVQSDAEIRDPEESDSDSDVSIALDTDVFWRPESVKGMAESVGAELDDDSSVVLSQSVINKLRHVTLLAMQYSRHGKTGGLRVDDFRKAEKTLDRTVSMGYGLTSDLPDYLDAGDFCVELDGPTVDVASWNSNCEKGKVEDLEEKSALSTSYANYHDSLSEAFSGKESELIEKIAGANGELRPIDVNLIRKKVGKNGKASAKNISQTVKREGAKRQRSVTQRSPDSKRIKNGTGCGNGNKSENLNARTTASAGADEKSVGVGNNSRLQNQKVNLSDDSDDLDDSSDEEDFVLVEEKERIRVIHLTDEVPELDETEEEAHTPGSVPAEWTDYVQNFIVAFHDNSEVVPFCSKSESTEFDEISTCSVTEFDVILKDVQSRGAFPVLHVLCDFFQNYVKETYQRRVTRQLRRIVSFINCMMTCPIRCKIFHLEPMLSTLKDMLMVPAHAEVQSYAASSILKVADYSEHPYNLEIAKWITHYINATLDVGSKLELEDMSNASKAKICAAVHLACGFIQRALKLKRVKLWTQQITKICQTHHVVLNNLETPSELTECYADTYLEDALLTFVHLYTKRSKAGPNEEDTQVMQEFSDCYKEKLNLCEKESMVSLTTSSSCVKFQRPHLVNGGPGNISKRTGWIVTASKGRRKVTIPLKKLTLKSS